jgi:hypothetical protein
MRPERGLSIRRGGKQGGRAALLVLLLAAALASAVVLLWLLVESGEGREREGAREPGNSLQVFQEEDPEALPAETARDPAPGLPPAGAARPDLSLQAAALAAGDPDRFRGTGSIAGRVEARGTADFPMTWSVVIEPSTSLLGAERAVRRVLQGKPGERSFLVGDLPLAGYDLRVEAPGWNSPSYPVLLDRDHPNPTLTVQIHPAGSIAGRVVDSESLPAIGLAVFLESRVGRERRETRTDLSGAFRFEGVLDGDYTLFVGQVETPLVEPSALRFAAPFLDMPPIELPPLARVRFTAIDKPGFPVPGVRVYGSGNRGGRIDGETDMRGELLVELLPAGRYRIRTEHPSYERLRESMVLVAGEIREVQLRMR